MIALKQLGFTLDPEDPYQWVGRQFVEEGANEMDNSSLFLRLRWADFEHESYKTEIRPCTNKHVYILDTSSKPAWPTIDGYTFVPNLEDLKSMKSQYLAGNPAVPHCVIIEAQIITADQYNQFYLAGYTGKLGIKSN